MLKYGSEHSYDDVQDLEKVALIRFQHDHYVLLGVLFGFALPMALASFWGDALGGLLIAGFLRIVLNHHFTFSINSVCHYLGTQPYSDRNTSRDSWIPALFTYGEGYHNYHHTFPSDYRNGIRAYHWDPTKWLIKGLEMIGQASNLRRIPDDTILRARLRMDEKRLMRKIERANAAVAVRREFVTSARLKLEEAYTRFRALKVEYAKLKEERLAIMNERLEVLRADMVRARQTLRTAVADWAHLCGRFGVTSTRLAYTS
jgi:stearoyl-CoA desaturase (delta-9 desaturase)